jgi:hypothetical protein
MCLVGCGVLVNVRDARVVNVIGNPDSPVNRGRICAKGKSGIMNHYNPNRVMKPLKRTNPEKGMGVDPKWREISWDEAIDAVAAKMRKICAEDPRKLYLQTWGASQEFTTWLGVLPCHQHATCRPEFLPTAAKPFTRFNSRRRRFHQGPISRTANMIDCGTQMGVATREVNHQVPDCAKARAGHEARGRRSDRQQRREQGR